MRLKYETLKNRQLGDALLRYVDGEVLETPQNIREFDALTREIIRRLKEGPEWQFNRMRDGNVERSRSANRLRRRR